MIEVWYDWCYCCYDEGFYRKPRPILKMISHESYFNNSEHLCGESIGHTGTPKRGWVTDTKTERSSWWLPWSSLGTLRLEFKVSSDDQGTLQWRHNVRDGVSNHQPHDCLLNCPFRRRSNKTSKLCVTGLCTGNSLVTGEFPHNKGLVTRKMFPFDDVIMSRPDDISVSVQSFDISLWIVLYSLPRGWLQNTAKKCRFRQTSNI